METARDCDAGGNAVNGLTNGSADATDADVTCVATVSLNGQVSVDSLHEVAPNSAPGTCVLELNCTTSNNTDGSGAEVEQYASRLFQKTDFEEGVLITSRQFEESTAKANREVLETGDEVTASTHLRFRENEKIKESDCGKTVSEYTSSNEETHQSTTCSYAVVGDKVVKTAKTRRSSTTREVSRKNGGPESQEGIELDTESKGPPFEIELAQDKVNNMATKTGAGVKKPDKYKVSFHSDTSDSESESASEDEIKPPMKAFKAKEPSPISTPPDTTNKTVVDNLTNGINGDVDKSSSSSASQSISSSSKSVDYQSQNGSATLLDLDPFGIGVTSTSAASSSAHVKSSTEISEAKSEVKTSVNSSGSDLLIDLRADSSAADADTVSATVSSLNTNITEQSISTKNQDLSLGENFSILTGAPEQKTAGGMQEIVFDEAQTSGISSDSKKTISDDIGDRVEEIKVNAKASSLDGNEMNTTDSLAFGVDQKTTAASARLSAETQQETKTSESYRREKATLSENKMEDMEEISTESRKKTDKHNFEDESSDDLIKRVLEQARRERDGKKAGGSRYRVDMEDDMRYDDHKDNVRSAERRRYDVDDHDDEPTLSETRISPSKYDSKGGNLYSERDGRYGGRKIYLAEDIEESMYSRRRESPFTGDMDDEPEYEASAREKARASWRQKQTAVYDDDEVFDSSSVHSSDYGVPYRQQYEYGRPVTDEDFLPQKRDETDEIVKEKTADIRNVVDKQASVIHKLRRASESFDELTNEIKNLKQDMLEREVQRTIMYEQRRHEEQEEREREAMELREQQREQRAALYDSPARGGPDDYEPYAQYSRSEQDMDSQYKRRAYGSPSRFSRSARGVEEEDDDDVLKRYSSVYAGYSKNKRYTRSQSLVDYDDYDLGSKASDSSERKPKDYASLYSSKYKDTAPGYDSKISNLKTGEKKSTDYASLYSKKYSDNASDYDTGSSSGYRSSYASRKTAKYQSADSDYKSSSTAGSDYKGYDFSKPPSGSEYRRSGLKSEYGSYSSRSTDRSSRANQFQRANTLADFDFDKPYESKFLRKVKERKAAGDDISASSSPAASKRDKPFKSRFLNKSFDSSDYSSKSSSRSASMSSTSATSGTRASAKSDSATGQKATEKQDS